ncbi:MAG: hypothetical protein KDA65_13480 [Planctomycetaceae bacterium]|nr:hypothetical protein [Planctomycetaceae bacterium]
MFSVNLTMLVRRSTTERDRGETSCFTAGLKERMNNLFVGTNHEPNMEI